MPFPLVVPAMVVPVAASVIVALAPGRTAPLGSVTVPVIVARSFWPFAIAPANRSNKNIEQNRTLLREITRFSF